MSDVYSAVGFVRIQTSSRETATEWKKQKGEEQSAGNAKGEGGVPDKNENKAIVPKAEDASPLHNETFIR